MPGARRVARVRVVLAGSTCGWRKSTQFRFAENERQLFEKP
jgi:hypothetical protein